MEKSQLLSVVCMASISLGMGVPAFAMTAETGSLAAQDIQVLEALGLENNPAVSWADRQVRGSTYTFTGFRQTGEDFTMTAETLVIEGLRDGAQGPTFDSMRFVEGRMFSEGESDFASYDLISIASPSDAMVAVMAAGFRGEEEQAEPFAQFSQATGEMVVEGFRASFGDELDPQAGEIEVSIARMELDDADGDALADMSLNDLVVSFIDVETGAPFSFSIEGMSGTGVLTESLINGVDPERFDPELTFAKTYDTFEMSNLRLVGAGVRVTMPSATSTMEELSNGTIRTTANMPSFTLAFDPEADPEAAKAAAGLAMLGYESLHLSYTSSYVYDPAEDRLYSDGPNAMTLRDGGTFNVRFDMSGMTKYLESAMDLATDAAATSDKGAPAEIDNAAAMQMLASLALNGLSVSFDDDGLLERGLGLFATQSGVDVETARMQAAGMVALMSMGAGDVLPQTVLMQMNQAVTGFIQHGGTLEVSLQPSEPLTFVDMIMDADGRFDAAAAGLSFSHEGP